MIPRAEQGTIEYLPGKYAHRPVDAGRYLFIQCLFSGYRKEFKGKGYGSRLIDECLKEARLGGFQGVAVVTRKGPFMAYDGQIISHHPISHARFMNIMESRARRRSLAPLGMTKLRPNAVASPFGLAMTPMRSGRR